MWKNEDYRNRMSEIRKGLLVGTKNPMFGKPSTIKGKVVINNGIKSICIQPNELDKYLSEGWQRGKMKKLQLLQAA